ncbi:MAG: LytTR family transcriptional regulator, partial [Cytophagaceae bacterium]
HKSCIVNITKVRSYQSRLNGDYDLLLSNEVVLRVSRNYASGFKTAFEGPHRLAHE